MLSCVLIIIAPQSFPFILMVAILFIFSLTPISLQTTLVRGDFLVDPTRQIMCFITIYVLYASYLFSPRSFSCVLSLVGMLVCCLGVFTQSNLLLLYFFYEASLLPIIYIILKWGVYPERSLSAILLLIYTVFFTLPFLYVIRFFWQRNMTLSCLTSPVCSSPFLLLLSFFCFSVKLPIYGLHFWLPIAHVEAPTFGSMLLAGVLLKLGGVGLVRLIPLFSSSLLDFTLAYVMVSLPLVTLICCLQRDIKRLVAYSSVRHILSLIPLFSLGTLASCYSGLLIMFFHGISSPLLFILVGTVYASYSTRQLTLIRGLLVSSPVLAFVSVLSFLFTLSAPPFPSFVREVFFILRALHLSPLFAPRLFIFCFLSLVYNINWLSSLVFSSCLSSRAIHYSYSEFMPIFLRCRSPFLLVLILCRL